MAWERRGQRRYYYSARRMGGKVVKTYLGTGETAIVIGQCVEGRRQQRELERIANMRALPAELTGAMDDLDAVGEALAHATLLVAGYRKHKRGEWRRQRPRQATTDHPKARRMVDDQEVQHRDPGAQPPAHPPAR